METNVNVLAPSRVQGALNQRLISLVVLEDLNACHTRLGHMKDRTARTNRASLTPSPVAMYSASEVDNDTTFFVLLAWLTTVPPKVTAVPDTERIYYGD